jgi:hypothetical protein
MKVIFFFFYLEKCKGAKQANMLVTKKSSTYKQKLIKKKNAHVILGLQKIHN